MKYLIKTEEVRQLADTTTPVSIYLKVRDRYPHALLLESSDYHSRDNSYSYICCSPMAEFSMRNGTVSMQFPDGSGRHVDAGDSVVPVMEEFIRSFEQEVDSEKKFLTNGLFGYMTYDAVEQFEDIEFKEVDETERIPDLLYHLFRFVIVIDHFKNQLFIFRHTVEGVEDDGRTMRELTSLLENKRVPEYHFKADEGEKSNLTDDAYMEIVELGKHHCRRGDVFQIVMSREFSRGFRGDEFNVYRALRSINPSPYLFFFDYGGHRIFGSSPEAQLIIRNGVAKINPIAGTYLRTGDDVRDLELAEQLKKDKKENSEHVMLVDLARNDLSRNASNVEVSTFRDIHFYSHVIHMVSEVKGEIGDVSTAQLAADTFPAGTLSGAPKHMAMQLIDRYEPDRRGFYGGAIGIIGFNGEFNHAITIRSFMSANNVLTYRAGAGIVVDSNAEKELQEVNNKIAALRSAIKLAEEI